MLNNSGWVILTAFAVVVIGLLLLLSGCTSEQQYDEPREYVPEVDLGPDEDAISRAAEDAYLQELDHEAARELDEMAELGLAEATEVARRRADEQLLADMNELATMQADLTMIIVDPNVKTTNEPN